jgi:hypothetical protein
MDALLPLLSYLPRHLPSPSEVIEWFRHVPPLTAFSGGILLWLALVRTFRWRRYNAIHHKYGPKWNNGKGIITPEEAQHIMAVSGMYDMPMLLSFSGAFALFKTYGIVRISLKSHNFNANHNPNFQPSISKLLASTKELKSKETISRRYADVCLLYLRVA